ncbi:MAG: SWIM zinc finger family protein [Methanospirillaceae archaeon]|nr:SWIM zinc finger family protein [Methanospirillaceae archaeon]
MSWYYYPKASPRSVKDGIALKSKRGTIGEHWWSVKFLEALHAQGMDSRLQRGRSYARKGQVMNLQIVDGVVEAKVQGTRPRPYNIIIRLKVWDENQWRQVISVIGEQALYSAQMLAGEMPTEIEGIVEPVGLSLFPQNRNDLTATCSCPDYANPCKHIAAVYYILAEQFDDEPFLLFAMRGKNKDDLLLALREQRGLSDEKETPDAEQITENEAVSLPSPDGFYSVRGSLDDFSVNLTTKPEVPDALLRMLGSSPFSMGRKNLSDLLRPAYLAGPLYVEQLVFGDEQDLERSPVGRRKKTGKNNSGPD